jgi:hypothetical protein
MRTLENPIYRIDDSYEIRGTFSFQRTQEARIEETENIVF